jgi:uncharacterized protein YecE (DUF72 family)
MGVTTLAQVNGAGAYSARNAAKGKSKHQRIQAARALLNNSGGKTVQKRGRRASFVSNATPAAKRRGKRLAAYNAAKKRGLTKNAAARSALRKVPWSDQGAVPVRLHGEGRRSHDHHGKPTEDQKRWDRRVAEWLTFKQLPTRTLVPTSCLTAFRFRPLSI